MANAKNIQIENNFAEIPDSYTKSEIDQMLSQITGVTFQVVNSLPSTGDPGTIYLLSSGGINPTYTMYIYSGGAWRQVSSTVDLSNYYTKSDADTKFYPFTGGVLTGTSTWRNPTDSANNHIAIGASGTTGDNYVDQYRSGYRVRVWPNDLTADRNIRWPNASGTVALTSQIITPTYQYSSASIFAGSGTSYEHATLYSIDIPTGLYVLNAWGKFQTHTGRCGVRISYNPDSPTALGDRFTVNNAFISGSSYTNISFSSVYNNTSAKTIFVSIFQYNTAGDGITVPCGLIALRVGNSV